jgi:hypothetical protein
MTPAMINPTKRTIMETLAMKLLAAGGHMPPGMSMRH